MSKIPKTAYDLLRETAESEGVSLESVTGRQPFINPQTGEPLIFNDSEHGDFTYVGDTISGKRAFRGSKEMRDYDLEGLKNLKCSRSQPANV